ncbi:MAG: anti-sigma factor [Paracoccaceae bacterium]
MSDLPTITPEFELDLLAAEYVIGLLGLEERMSVETRLREGGDLAERVAEWEHRLSDLNDDYAEVPVQNLMPQIEARLFPAALVVKRNLLSNLWAWGSAAAAAVALVAYLALTPAAPSYTAILTADAGNLKYEAVITQDKLTLTRVSGTTADASHSYELWVIAGDNPPVSLGVIPGDAESITRPGLAAGQTLAITLEPLGGSPTGKPTGPVVAKGQLIAA